MEQLVKLVHLFACVNEAVMKIALYQINLQIYGMEEVKSANKEMLFWSSLNMSQIASKQIAHQSI
jgi:hypothetical protein